jgi:transposase
VPLYRAPASDVQPSPAAAAASAGVACRCCPGGVSRSTRSRCYPSDMTGAEWAVCEPLLPAPAWLAGRGGRPARYCMRDIVDAIRYLTHNGPVWRALPVDFPPAGTVYYWAGKWEADGSTARMHDDLRERVRMAAGRNPASTAAIIDSQSVKGSEMVVRAGRGYDAGKAETYTRQALTGGGSSAWRYTETDTTYDASTTDADFGLPTHAYTHTVPVSAAYDQCTTTSYAAANTGANLVGLAAETEADSVACGGFTEGSPASVPAALNTLTATGQARRTPWPRDPGHRMRPLSGRGSRCAIRRRGRGDAGQRGGLAASQFFLTGMAGVSCGVRWVILLPSQTSGSYLRPTTRSFMGMSALSVILMFSGQTSVQHLVMLQ